jgi:hypothetical protein
MLFQATAAPAPTATAHEKTLRNDRLEGRAACRTSLRARFTTATVFSGLTTFGDTAALLTAATPPLALKRPRRSSIDTRRIDG